MALFRDLSSAIADAEGISEMTVTGVGQYLRDAGLITKHGRGRAAAQMTVSDAVNWLVGVVASDLAKNAVETVMTYRELTVGPEPKRNREDDVSRYITDEDNNFGSALEFLVSQLIPINGLASAYKQLLDNTSSYIQIGFGRPIPSSFISVRFRGPPNVSNPFQAGYNFETAAFAHYWNCGFTWAQHDGQKVLKILGSNTLPKIASTIAT